MQVTAYIRSLKDIENDRHVLGEATILEKVGDNLYLAEYNGVHARRSSISSLGATTSMTCTASHSLNMLQLGR